MDVLCPVYLLIASGKKNTHHLKIKPTWFKTACVHHQNESKFREMNQNWIKMNQNLKFWIKTEWNPISGVAPTLREMRSSPVNQTLFLCLPGFWIFSIRSFQNTVNTRDGIVRFAETWDRNDRGFVRGRWQCIHNSRTRKRSGLPFFRRQQPKAAEISTQSASQVTLTQRKGMTITGIDGWILEEPSRSPNSVCWLR